MKHVVTMLLLFVLCSVNFIAFSQSASKSKPQNKTGTQTATTTDGKKVILMSDGTWKYADTISSSTQPNRAVERIKTGILSIEAGLVFQSGDIKPVARTTFFLLDENPATTFRNAGLNPPQQGAGLEALNAPTDDNLIYAFGSSFVFYEMEEYRPFYDRATNALKPHIVQQLTTGFDGKGSFPPTKVGSYYLLGITKTFRGFAIWSLKVGVNEPSSSLILDQNNALYAS